MDATSTRETLTMTRSGVTTPASRVGVQAVQPVADHGESQVEVGRHLDEPDSPVQVEIDNIRVLLGGSVGLWIRFIPYGIESPVP